MLLQRAPGETSKVTPNGMRTPPAMSRPSKHAGLYTISFTAFGEGFMSAAWPAAAGPCRFLRPLKNLAANRRGKLKVVKYFPNSS
jgi:hypothetical protein